MMSERCCVVTESTWDEALVKRVLASELSDGKVMTISSPGSVAAASTARSVLVVQRIPTALIVDADSSDSETIEERREFFDGALRPYSGSVPIHISLVVPELEACFFEDPKFLEQVGLPRLDTRQEERAKYRPRQLLNELLSELESKRRSIKWASELPDGAVQTLREVCPFKDLIQFIQSLSLTATH